MKKVNAIMAGVCAIVMMSCAPMYVSNRQNIPLLIKEGEIRASGSIGESGIDVQAAAALTQETAVMVNAQIADLDFNYYDDINNIRQKTIEAALGYYKPIGSNGVFEIYGGYGIGSSEREEYNIDKKSKGDFYKIFIQPNVGFYAKYFSVGFGMRAQFVKYDRINDVQTNNDQFPMTKTYTSQFNAKGYFVEPSLTVKAGTENFKVISQIGVTLPLKNIDYDYQPITATIGIEYTIGK